MDLLSMENGGEGDLSIFHNLLSYGEIYFEETRRSEFLGGNY